MSLKHRATVFVTIILASSLLAAAAEVNLTALTLREGTPINVVFGRSSRAPGRASVSATLNFEKGQASIDLTYKRMEPAVLFSGDITTYILWAVSPDGTVDNLGEVRIEQKSFSGSQKFYTSKRIFALMLTAEPFTAVRKPTAVVLFTSGQVVVKNITNTPFTFSDFSTEPKPALESIAVIQYNDRTPAPFRQAHKVLEMAIKMNAVEANPKAMNSAGEAFSEADKLVQTKGNKKMIIDKSKVAVQLASQAIAETLKAREAAAAAAAEAKRQAERAALEQRASTAETEAQQIARQLKEVEAQRTALAQESKSLAGELENLAAEQKKLEADREAIKKERDELAGMLKGALSSVAETNESARGVIVSLPGILFDVGKATLTMPAQLTVAKLAGILMVFQNMNLSIEGHTDSTGSLELNMTLSMERARGVYAFLRSQGIPEGRMKYEGFGPSRPVAPNDVEANRAKNRRVEVVLTQAGKD